MLPELAVQPAVAVLVDGPLRLIQALPLIQVGCKDVPGTRHGQLAASAASTSQKRF